MRSDVWNRRGVDRGLAGVAHLGWFIPLPIHSLSSFVSIVQAFNVSKVCIDFHSGLCQRPWWWNTVLWGPLVANRNRLIFLWSIPHPSVLLGIVSMSNDVRSLASTRDARAMRPGTRETYQEHVFDKELKTVGDA